MRKSRQLQRTTLIIGHGDRRYRVLTDWGKLDASKYPIVNCHAMVQTKDGLLHTLCDGVRNNFLIYDKSGKLVHSWGTEYPGAHGLEVFDENGEQCFTLRSDEKGLEKPCSVGSFQTLIYPSEYLSHLSISIFYNHVA